MSDDTQTSRWERVARWFLVLSYGVGSPLFALAEFRTGMFSERFDFPPEFLYLTSGVQFLAALMLFQRRFVPWSIVVLTVLSVGAIYSHFRIDSPLTALPALAYTAIQVWYGFRVYRNAGDPG